MDLLGLTAAETTIIAVSAFCAGIVRGFTGFALSALVMVSAVLILPPVELIPMLWWLELSASLLMVRAGWAEADRRIALSLVVASSLGLPLGLWLTLNMAPEVSGLVALSVIVVLAASQLARVRIAALATWPGLLLAGLTAGIVTGLSGAGAMVVALYALALERPARVIRASLVLYLFVSLAVSFVTYGLVGAMDGPAIARGLAFAIPTAAGVLLGKALFVPRYEVYYKPICLGLLIALASVGILKELTT
ncbi:MAG: sulfite exporter TauE/SafE family protein [Pseudomonadota bacterium]